MNSFSFYDTIADKEENSYMERKVVLITGASRGIGAAIAEKMASLNYQIVINYLQSEQQAKELKKKLEEKYSIQVLTICADVSKEEDVKRMIQTVIQEFGSIDCLVNNAGIAIDNYFEEKTQDEFKKVLDTNLVGAFLMSKYVGQYFKKMSKGNIVNITSTNGIDTNEIFSMDYDASKAGLISLTHNFAKALAPLVG